MNAKTLPAYSCSLFLSGPIEVARQVIRRECLNAGLCVTVTPTTFIYTGGEEQGYEVGLIDYPRFPAGRYAVRERAKQLALLLLAETYQQSALIIDDELTEWITTRDT